MNDTNDEVIARIADAIEFARGAVTTHPWLQLKAARPERGKVGL